MVQEAMSLLEEEAELIEIVRLVGAESISAKDRMTLETTRSIREDFLHQNAFHKVDTYSTIDKQFDMLGAILHFHAQGLAAIDNGVETSDIFALKVREDIARAKYIAEEQREQITEIRKTINDQMKTLQTVG
jgi:V/A-type H+-transporting ATPase subunit A